MKRQVKIGLLGISLLAVFMVLLLMSKNTIIQGYSTYLSEPVINTKTTPIKAVIFDLGNVLIKTSTPKLVWHLGFIDILKYMVLEQKDPRSLKYRVQEIVAAWAKTEGISGEDGRVPSYDGTPIPVSMQAWQKGQLSGQELYKKSMEFLNLHEKVNPCGYHEKKLVIKCVQLLAQPDIQIQTKERMSHIIEIVQKIKQQHDGQGNRKFKLIILSNMEQEVVPYIKQAFSDVISLFDDHIFSGEVKMMKPYKEIYDLTIERNGLKHHECFFVDDLEENIAAAKEYGWKTFHLHKHSTAEQLYAELQTQGILA